MILPDVNLLVYAYNMDAPRHEAARSWWEELLNGDVDVGIPWAAALGFVRIMTSRRVLHAPLRPDVALDYVESWLRRPGVRVLDPGPRHLSLIRQLLRAVGIAGSLTTDAHLAALAIEHQAELHSNDADFARFPALRWVNPLED